MPSLSPGQSCGINVGVWCVCVCMFGVPWGILYPLYILNLPVEPFFVCLFVVIFVFSITPGKTTIQIIKQDKKNLKQLSMYYKTERYTKTNEHTTNRRTMALIFPLSKLCKTLAAVWELPVQTAPWYTQCSSRLFPRGSLKSTEAFV